jgi:hypothetical protein
MTRTTIRFTREHTPLIQGYRLGGKAIKVVENEAERRPRAAADRAHSAHAKLRWS